MGNGSVCLLPRSRNGLSGFPLIFREDGKKGECQQTTRLTCCSLNILNTFRTKLSTFGSCDTRITWGRFNCSRTSRTFSSWWELKPSVGSSSIRTSEVLMVEDTSFIALFSASLYARAQLVFSPSGKAVQGNAVAVNVNYRSE